MAVFLQGDPNLIAYYLKTYVCFFFPFLSINPFEMLDVGAFKGVAHSERISERLREPPDPNETRSFT